MVNSKSVTQIVCRDPWQTFSPSRNDDQLWWAPCCCLIPRRRITSASLCRTKIHRRCRLEWLWLVLSAESESSKTIMVNFHVFAPMVLLFFVILMFDFKFPNLQNWPFYFAPNFLPCICTLLYPNDHINAKYTLNM